MQELRDLARGIHPPVLRDFGLRAALASAAQRSTPPAALIADEHRPLPAGRRDRRLLLLPRVAAERRQARRRGRPRRGAGVRARAELRFEIVDDGVGCDIDRAAAPGPAWRT